MLLSDRIGWDLILLNHGDLIMLMQHILGFTSEQVDRRKRVLLLTFLFFTALC